MKKIFLLLVVVSCMLLCGCDKKSTEAESAGGAGEQLVSKVTDGYIQHEKRPVRMFMADGALYYDSGEVSSMTPRCGTLDGGLKKTVAENEIPKNNGESNFDVGREYFGYQFATDITKEVPIDGDWVIFKKYEDSQAELNRYKYCFYIRGRLPKAAKDSELIVLTEDESIDFKGVLEPLFSSQFNPDEERGATTFIFMPSEDE